MTAVNSLSPINNGSDPTMNNPYKPIPRRPERDDPTWDRRRDPLGHKITEALNRRGY